MPTANGEYRRNDLLTNLLLTPRTANGDRHRASRRQMFWSHQLPGVPSLLGLYLLFVFNKHSPMEKRKLATNSCLSETRASGVPTANGEYRGNGSMTKLLLTPGHRCQHRREQRSPAASTAKVVKKGPKRHQAPKRPTETCRWAARLSMLGARATPLKTQHTTQPPAHQRAALKRGERGWFMGQCGTQSRAPLHCDPYNHAHRLPSARGPSI